MVLLNSIKLDRIDIFCVFEIFIWLNNPISEADAKSFIELKV